MTSWYFHSQDDWCADSLRISQTSTSACCLEYVKTLIVSTPKEATGAHVNQATCWTLPGATVSVSTSWFLWIITRNLRLFTSFLCSNLDYNDRIHFSTSGQSGVWPEGFVLPLGFNGLMLSSTSQSPHQADMLLQQSGQGVGACVWSLSFTRIRYDPKSCPVPSSAGCVAKSYLVSLLLPSCLSSVKCFCRNKVLHAILCKG